MAQGVLALGSHTACLEGDVVWTWRPRHFTLDVSVPRQPVLLYARPNGEPPVSAELAGAALQEDRLDTRFRVDFADGRTYLLAATSVPECRAWVGALRQAIACAGGVAAASEEASRAAGALKSLTPIAAYWTASASGRSQGGSPSGAWSFAGALPGGLLNGAAPHSSSPACLPDRRRGEYDVSAVAAAAYEASLPCLHPPLGEARQRFAARRSMASGSGTLRSVPSSLESESSSGSLDRARSSRSAGSLPEPSPSSLAPLHSSPSMAVLGDGALAALPPPMAAASLEEQYERAHQYVQRHSGALPAEHRDVLESWYRAVEAGRGVAMAGAWEGWDAGVAGALPAPQHSPTPPCTPAFTPQASFVSGGAKRELPALGVSGSLQTSSQQSPIAAMAMFVLTLTRLVPDWASWGVQHSLYVSPEVMIAALRRRPWSSTLGDVAECAAFASPAWLRLFLAMGGADLLLQALVLHAQRAWGEGRRAQSRRLERERRRGEGQAAAEQLPSPLKPPPAGTLLRASSASAASAHRLAGQAAWEAWAQGAAAPLPPPPEGQSPVAKDGAQSRLAQSPLSACQGPPSYSLGPSPPPSPAQATEPPPSLRRGANSPAEPLEASDTRAAARQCAIVALQALHSLVSSGGGMAACMAHSDFLPAVCLALGRRDSLAAQLADQLLAEVCVYSPLGYAGTVRFLLGRRQDPAGVGTQASTASEVEIDGRRDVKRSLSLPAPARRPLSPCEAPEAFSFAQAVVHKGSEQEALSAASPTHPPLLAETSDPDPGSPASSSLAARSGSSVLFNLPCGTFVEHFPAEEALPAAPRAYPPLHSIAAPGTLSDLGPAQLPRSFRRDLLTELLAHLCPSSALGEGGEERELDVDLVEHTLRLLSILCRPLPTSFFAEQKLGEEGGEEEEGAGRTRGTEGTERARGTEGTERAPSRAEGGLASRPLTPSLHLPASLSASARAPTPCPYGPVHRPAALSLQVELVRALVARGLFRVLADLRDFGNAFLNAEVDVLKHAVHSVLQAEVQRDKAARRERERRLREASEEETKPAPPPPPPPPPAVAPAPKTPAKSAVKPGPPPPPPPPPPGRGAQPGRPPGPPPPPPPPGSGPRPPPPPPRGGPAPPQTDPGPCPRLKLRSLFWDRLPETRVQGTRWAAVKPAYDALDVPALEVAFAAAQRKSGSAASAVAAGPAQRLAVLDLKRATGIGIRCASLPLPASAIPDAAARLDACLVSCSSRLEALRACVPSADEASMLESFVRGDEARAANLAEAERLALRLGRLPRLEARLGALQALREAAGVLQDARAAARAHASAQRELAHGRVFAAALERVLALGNFLNHGSRLGAAPGFRLRILKKLGDTRSADGKTTLLTVLARQMNVFLDQEADKEGRLEAESFATVKEHLQGLTSPLLRVSLAEIEDTVQTLAVKLVAARAEVEAAAKELEDAGFGAEDPGQGEKGVGEAAGRPVQAVQAVRPSAAKQSVSVSSPTSTLEEERSGGTGSLAGAQPGIPVPQPLAPAPPQPAPAAPLALPAAASTRLLAAEAFVRRAGPRLSQVQAELEEVQATLSAVQAGFAEMAAAFGEPGGAGVSEQELLGGLQDWALALVAAQRHARAEDAAARAGPRLANQAASMVRAAFARKRAGKGGGKVDQSAAGGTETAGEHASPARSSIAVDAR